MFDINFLFPMCPAEIDCEPPNNRLHKFVGVLKMKDEDQLEDVGEAEQHSLDNDKILLRVKIRKIAKWFKSISLLSF